MALDLAIDSYIWHLKHKEQQQKDKLYFIKLKNFV